MSLRASYSYIPSGWGGTAATIRAMGRLAARGSKDQEIILAARGLVRGLPARDWRGEASSVLDFVRSRVRYTLDPMAVEWVQTPRVTLREGMGDCDDATTLLAAMTLALGMEAGFRTIKADARKKDEFSHVFPIVRWPGELRWQAADPTEQTPLGVSPEQGRTIYGAQNWRVDAERETASPDGPEETASSIASASPGLFSMSRFSSLLAGTPRVAAGMGWIGT